MSLDEFLSGEPHSRSSGDLYMKAMEEYIFPVRSTRILDFPKFDEMTQGFRVREFTILCGATGVGKTCLLANWSASWIKQEVPHFVASVETGPTDFIRRILSVLEGKNLNTGQRVHPDLIKKINERHGDKLQTDTLQLSLYEDRFSVEVLMSDIAWHVKHHGVKVALIDNLNFFMEVVSSNNQIVEMDRVIHSLIIFCKKVDVHLVMVMHPKKTDHGRVDSEFDIKGSSTAVQEAHNIFLFNRPHPDLIESGKAVRNDREIKIQKMRRLGQHVGRRLVLTSVDTVKYCEGGLF